MNKSYASNLIAPRIRYKCPLSSHPQARLRQGFTNRISRNKLEGLVYEKRSLRIHAYEVKIIVGQVAISILIKRHCNCHNHYRLGRSIPMYQNRKHESKILSSNNLTKSGEKETDPTRTSPPLHRPYVLSRCAACTNLFCSHIWPLLKRPPQSQHIPGATPAALAGRRGASLTCSSSSSSSSSSASFTRR